MELVLQQKQTLNLVMTTELRQAITLLQYTTYELYQFIQEQALENPLIELEERFQDTPYKERSSNTSQTGMGYQNLIDFIASNDKGMRDYLIEQTQWLDISDKEREIIRYLIHNLDENAYLPLEEVDIADQLTISEIEVKQGVNLLQQLEPVGVGARSLQECLLLQIRRYYPEETMAEQLIRDYLDLLANKKWQELSRKMNLSLAEIKTIYDLIQTLDPKPCTAITDGETEYLNPDIIVEESRGEFVVYLNDGYIPHIHFNNQYADLLKTNNETSKYINDRYRNYQWLLSSIEQRRTTILKITNVIIEKQFAFFRSGFAALKPLTLREVADEIVMHESTVSRATMNKVIQTPKGSFEFRRLFTSKLNINNGSSMSQTKVKILLEEFVKKEDKYKPLSDQRLAGYFKSEKGITISRRTIAKYRDELNIPSSRQWKEIKIY